MATITVEQAIQNAFTLYRAGKLAEAEVICHQILTAHPSEAAAISLLGTIALTTGRHEKALELISKATALAPTNASYHSDLGLTLHRLGRLEDALTCFQRALVLRPDLYYVHLNLADTLHSLTRFDEAISSCRQALTLRPDCVEAHNILGNACRRKGNFDESGASFLQALALQPSNVRAICNLGSLHFEMGELDKAIECYNRALTLQPDLADGHANLGVIFFEKRMFERALLCFRQAVAYRPDFPKAHWGLATLLLLLGRHEEGWAEYEWRWRHADVASLRQSSSSPHWDGGLVPGQTILVHAEQGLGDTLQFVRFLPLVREHAQAAHVIFECPPVLARLLEHTGGWQSDIVVCRGVQAASPPTFDRHIPLLSLPLALRSFEPQYLGPYLRTDPTLRAVWHERLGQASTLRVGLAWAGSATHRDDHRRSIPFEKFLPLVKMPGVTAYSLQIEPRRDGLEPRPDAGLIDFTANITDFADAAALMAEMDLIISVDTATVHLAGALGRPVWTLLPLIPDWRWGLEREDTPWYPTMRLFRQRTLGNWNSVLERVTEALASARQ